MADNVTITAGSGETISADEVSGVKVQRVKVQYGSDGSATDVDATNRLPVEAKTGINDSDAAAGSDPVFPAAAEYRSDANIAASGLSAADYGHLRMTQTRELLVAPRSLSFDLSSSSVDTDREVLFSTTSKSAGFAAPATGDFAGTGNWTDTGNRYIRINMRSHTNGIGLGMYHNLGSDVTIKLWAVLDAGGTGTANFPQLDTWTISSGSFAYVTPYAVSAGAVATLRSVPALLMPMTYLLIDAAAASNPSSGQFILYGMR